MYYARNDTLTSFNKCNCMILKFSREYLVVLINFYFLSGLEQKKSRMERCGDLGGQLTGPLFPIQGCKKC